MAYNQLIILLYITLISNFHLSFFSKNNSDDDECAGASDRCGQGECVNVGGSFKCICLPGFDLLVIWPWFYYAIF